MNPVVCVTITTNDKLFSAAMTTTADMCKVNHIIETSPIGGLYD